MYTTILVPLDGSPVAERALPFAQTMARATRAGLLLVRSALLEPSTDETVLDKQAQALTEARRYLESIVSQLRSTTRVETAVLYGEAAAAILTVVTSRKVDLVVMSSHGHSGLDRWVIGTVADRVLRRADVPVLVIPAACVAASLDGRALRILVPLDGSSLAEEALESAKDLARVLHAELVLVRAIDPMHGVSVGPTWYVSPAFEGSSLASEVHRYLELTAARLRDQGLTVAIRCAIGPPGPTIAAAASEEHVTMIAMTPHGIVGPSRLLLGSVATTVLQEAHVPVLLVRPSAMREAQPQVGTAAEATGFEGLPVSVVLTPRQLGLIVNALESTLIARAASRQGLAEIQELLTHVQRAAIPFEPRAIHLS
jgi:nucleotide-binding universal stress UspA family protein